MQTVRFQTARLHTATLLPSAPNVLVQLASSARGLGEATACALRPLMGFSTLSRPVPYDGWPTMSFEVWIQHSSTMLSARASKLVSFIGSGEVRLDRSCAAVRTASAGPRPERRVWMDSALQPVSVRDRPWKNDSASLLLYQLADATSYQVWITWTTLSRARSCQEAQADDGVCRLCAQRGVRHCGDSLATVCSFSSSEGSGWTPKQTSRPPSPTNNPRLATP